MRESLEGKKYLTIGEVSRATKVPEYTIRYWETEMKVLRPIRQESGHRRYSKKDVQTVMLIKDMIYRQGMTMDGAKRFLRTHGSVSGKQMLRNNYLDEDSLKLIKEIHRELCGIIKEC